MEDCIFCKIIKGEIPAKKIYEDEKYLAFLDIKPNTKGHSLVIPKKHITNFTELTKAEVGELAQIVHKIAPQVVKLLSSDSFFLGLNNGRESGQIVDHVHWHIIPRYSDDGLVHWPCKEEENKLLDETFSKLENKIK